MLPMTRIVRDLVSCADKSPQLSSDTDNLKAATSITS